MDLPEGGLKLGIKMGNMNINATTNLKIPSKENVELAAALIDASHYGRRYRKSLIKNGYKSVIWYKLNQNLVWIRIIFIAALMSKKFSSKKKKKVNLIIFF